MSDSLQAREDWESRISHRSDAAAESSTLSAPTEVVAESGTGHIRLSWEPVPAAAGYVIEVADGCTVPTVLRHGGSDVAAIPMTHFAVTGVDEGVEYHLRVAAVRNPGDVIEAWSAPVVASTRRGALAPIEVDVDAASVIRSLRRVWEMVGAERLSQLRLGVDEHGHDVGHEFAEALRIARDELGVRFVRAHAILHDDLAVVRRDPRGLLSYDFAGIDAVYDRLVEIGIRPIVELSFMPAALARDPHATVFTYRGIISPPTNWTEWHDLVCALVRHLVERYGIDEVAAWGFEVWNEANLEVFWTGTREEYLRLYEEAARAVKEVDERLRVGGPGSAAGEWVEALLDFASARQVPLDFVSTHTYGNLPIDLRPQLERYDFAGIPIWWTEWGVGSTHFGAIHDSPMGAPFILQGYDAVQGRLDALAYWVISDHFEELGRPPRLFHDGFGLLSVGNLRKPRFWAAHLAAAQGDDVLSLAVSGDGAEVLVGASATRHNDGSIDVLVWNGTINTEMSSGDPRLDRTVSVRLRNLAHQSYVARLARVDAEHSNIIAALPAGVDWPDAATWSHLRASDVLHQERLADVQPTGGEATVTFFIPMPGVARLRLSAG
ncbi:MAG: xylan 1,4-beta-xylosidase [Acidimicrobiaceae bacterium]|nr:xylan 1,4-beta-xylosidase [Acidimicrobiaceae bacterium]